MPIFRNAKVIVIPEDTGGTSSGVGCGPVIFFCFLAFIGIWALGSWLEDFTHHDIHSEHIKQVRLNKSVFLKHASVTVVGRSATVGISYVDADDRDYIELWLADFRGQVLSECKSKNLQKNGYWSCTWDNLMPGKYKMIVTLKNSAFEISLFATYRFVALRDIEFEIRY